MRILVPLLVLSALATAGETVQLPDLGLTIEMPDGWKRESSREQGAIKFAAILEHQRDRFVRFAIETSPADNFEAEAWLEFQKQQMGQWFKEMTVPFKRNDRTIAGRTVAGCSAGGRVVSGDKEFDLHFRVAGLARQGIFYQLTELSYNDAHNEKAVQDGVEKMWQGVRLDDIQLQEGDETPPAGDPAKHEDEAANFSITLPPGWQVDFAAPTSDDDRGIGQRLVISRRDSNDNSIVVLDMLRIEMLNSARIFASGTAGEALEMLQKQEKMFERYYGEGSANHLHPRIDEGVTLAEAEKSGAYEFKSITMEEQQAIREAEDKDRRGIKDVVIPEYDPLVVRGRIALLSPHIYLLRGVFVRRDAAEDPAIKEEFNKLLDSFSFFESTARPPAMRVGDIEFPDTTADPANAEDRKVTAVAQHKGRKIYQMGVEFVVPKGFQLLTRDEIKRFYADPDQVSIVMVAQDENNNWVKVLMHHSSAKALGDQKLKHGDKREVFDSWRSNWQSKCPRAKIPSKTRKFTLGRIRGEGYEALEGKVDKFRGTFTCMVDDKSGWRTYLEVETRGQGDRVFEEGLGTFYKSLRVKKMKDLK